MDNPKITTDHICGPFAYFLGHKATYFSFDFHWTKEETIKLGIEGEAYLCSCHKLYVVKDGRLVEHPPTPDPILPTFANAMNDLMQAPVADVATPRADVAEFHLRERERDEAREQLAARDAELASWKEAYQYSADMNKSYCEQIDQRDEAIRNHIASKNGWLCKYNESQAQLALAEKLLNAKTEEYKYAASSNQEQFKELEALTAELARVTAERDDWQQGANAEAHAHDEVRAQLAQARSELETVKRERDEWGLRENRLMQDLRIAKERQQMWHDRRKASEIKLTAAQQTISELNCKLAKYEKK